MGFGPDELRGKLVLDVGCGMDRFADIASWWGARVIGVDISIAAAETRRDDQFVGLQWL
jgi:2-polyprenyl-3-methyl-5-hydroxy-6-metoxy-1,4-benzoquinol methylase